MEGTLVTTGPVDWPHPENCTARDVLDRVGDRWTVYVVAQLGTGTMRFTEIRRSVEGISQRMLTVTLRALERDGLVERHMYPVIPPRVDYSLTDQGRSLLDVVGALVEWSAEHTNDILAARERYDSARAVERSSSPTAISTADGRGRGR
jgi:DNA-binding HxlR family transcriptional regulator